MNKIWKTENLKIWKSEKFSGFQIFIFTDLKETPHVSALHLLATESLSDIPCCLSAVPQGIGSFSSDDATGLTTFLMENMIGQENLSALYNFYLKYANTPEEYLLFE